MKRAALMWVLLAVGGARCGGKTTDTGAKGSACDAPTLTNCPQDTATDAGQCPLPPLIEAQGFYSVGCRVEAACSSGKQVCVCSMTPSGPEWGCAL